RGRLDQERGTLPAGADLLGATLQRSPAALLTVTAQGLAEELALRPALLLGDALGFTDQVRGERKGEDSRRTHAVLLILNSNRTCRLLSSQTERRGGGPTLCVILPSMGSLKTRASGSSPRPSSRSCRGLARTGSS